MLPWGEARTLAEELVEEAGEVEGLPVLLLAIQGVVRGVGRLVGAVPPLEDLPSSCDRAWLEGLARCAQVGLLVSSRASSVIEVDQERRGVKGGFVVAFDPVSLEGSGVAAASTFGVWRRGDSVLAPGRELVAAGLVTYGATTQLVLGGGGGASRYLLDSRGEFLHQGPVLIPPTGALLPPVPSSLPGLAWLGVAREGGVVATSPLPLLTTAAPLAFLTMAAGGGGSQAVLDTTPGALHHRQALTLGSR